MIQNEVEPTKSLLCTSNVQNRYEVKQSKNKKSKLISILPQLITSQAPFKDVDNSCFNYFPSTEICWHWLRNEHRIINPGCLLPFSSISIKSIVFIAHILEIGIDVFDKGNIFNGCLAYHKFCDSFLFVLLNCL